MTVVHPLIRQLSYLRYAQDITRQELAERIGRSYGTVVAWETGRRNPTIAALELWASALGCSLSVKPTGAAIAIPAVDPTNLCTCARCGRTRRHEAGTGLRPDDGWQGGQVQ